MSLRAILVTISVCILFLPKTKAQNCPPPDKERVLLVGDSWAQFMYVFGTHPEIFAEYGFEDIKLRGSLTTLVGTKADDWANDELQTILDELTNHPSLQIVILQLGANDLVSLWDASMTVAEELEVFSEVMTDVHTIVAAIEQVRPDIQILIGGYDYVNFVETIIDYPSILGSNPYASSWDGIGNPGPLQTNEAFSRFEMGRALYSQNDPRVFFVNAMGLMQYIYGYADPLPVPPGGTFAPGTVPFPGQAPDFLPLPGGDKNYPSPPAAMGGIPPGTTILLGYDCIHLAPDAYEHYVRNQMEYYLFEAFREDPDLSFTSEGGDRDGWTAVDGSTGTGELAAGSKNAILSFETASIPPGQVLSRASIFLRRTTATGTNPFDSNIYGNPQLDIISGSFGAPEIEAQDHTAAADLSDIGCFVGKVKGDKQIVRIDLDPTALININDNGTTQFRIKFSDPDSSGNDVFFHNGDQQGRFEAPILDIHYEQATAISDESDIPEISVYPVPASSALYVSTHESGLFFTAVSLWDMQGRMLQTANLSTQLNPDFVSLDVSDLQTGLYFIRIETEDQKTGRRVLIKN